MSKANTPGCSLVRSFGSGLIALLSVVLLVFSGQPALALADSFEALSIFRTLSVFSGMLFFYLSVVYLGSTGVLLARGRFKQAGIDAVLTFLCLAMMKVEPELLNMIALSGFQISVKLSIEFALIAICAVMAAGLLFLPSILAFLTGYKNKTGIAFLNLSGFLIFPFFITALYLVQKNLGEDGDSETTAIAPTGQGESA